MFKRFLALLLSCLVCWLSCSAAFSAFAASAENTDGLTAFTESLRNLVRTYDQGNSFIADEFLPTESDGTANADSLPDMLPITFSMQSPSVGVFSDGTTTVQLQNNSVELQVQSPAGEYTVLAESAAQFENGKCEVPPPKCWNRSGTP